MTLTVYMLDLILMDQNYTEISSINIRDLMESVIVSDQESVNLALKCL